MQAVLINPSPGEISALAHFVTNQPFCVPRIAWLAGFYPEWMNDGRQLGLKPKPAADTEDGDSMMVFLDPTETVAQGLCWQIAAKAFVFSGDLPQWAIDIKEGNPPSWAQTLGDNEQWMAMKIEILSLDKLAPAIREHLE